MTAYRNITRRTVLMSVPAAIVLDGCVRRIAIPGAREAPLPRDPAFLRLSQVLTGHTDLDPTTAARLSRGLAAVDPSLHAQLEIMETILRPSMSPSESMSAAAAVGVAPMCHAIIAAWYTGMVGTGVHATTVSYDDALMQRPVADALAPPTYVLGGPAWWTAPPPDIGLSRPVMRAPAPETVGNPGPKPQ